MGRPTTKETKVKGAFFKHRWVDASHQDVSQVQVSIEGVPVCAPYLKPPHHFEIQPKTTNFISPNERSSAFPPWKHALKPGGGGGRMVDQFKRKRVERVNAGKVKEGVFRVAGTTCQGQCCILASSVPRHSTHLQLEYRTVELDAEVDCLVVNAKVFVVQKVEIFRDNVAKSCVHMFQVVHIFKAALQQFENLYEHQIREKIKLHIRYLELSGKGENNLSSRLNWLGRNILL